MKDHSNVFIENEFRNAEEKFKEEKHYKVTIRNAANSVEIIENVVDVAFNNSVLTVSTIPTISYYRIKNLLSWYVERLE